MIHLLAQILESPFTSIRKDPVSISAVTCSTLYRELKTYFRLKVWEGSGSYEKKLYSFLRYSCLR